MQGHDGKSSIQCIYKETKNESNLVTCSLQAEREDIKRFLGLCVWQDGEEPLCTLPSCWANMDTEKNGLVNSCTWQYKGEVFSVAPHINACFFPLEKRRTGILRNLSLEQCSRVPNRSLHRTCDCCIWFLHDGHKACMVAASNTAEECDDKLE